MKTFRILQTQYLVTIPEIRMMNIEFGTHCIEIILSISSQKANTNHHVCKFINHSINFHLFLVTKIELRIIYVIIFFIKIFNLAIKYFSFFLVLLFRNSSRFRFVINLSILSNNLINSFMFFPTEMELRVIYLIILFIKIFIYTIKNFSFVLVLVICNNSRFPTVFIKRRIMKLIIFNWADRLRTPQMKFPSYWALLFFSFC